MSAITGQGYVPDSRLEHRVAIVTGSSSGLGRAMAVKFASCGAKVVCADIRPTARPLSNDKTSPVPTHELINQKFGKSDGERAIFVETDCTNEGAIKALVAKAVSFGDRLDIICNNAGIATETDSSLSLRIHETPVGDYDRTHALNQRAVWLGCKYAITQFMSQEPRRPNSRGERTRGWIINTASMLGLIGLHHAPCYVPTKHAVVGITRQVAIDYAKDRIHCNCLCPGFVKSAMIDTLIPTDDHEARLGAAHPWGVLGRPEDVADAALFLASDEASWVTGHPMVVDGGYIAQ